MKLSEALRKGIEEKPVQIKGRFLDDEDGACALGCVTIGANLDFIFIPTFALEEAFPELSHRVPISKIPDCVSDTPSFKLFVIIVCLNDNADWTREQIADWLESINL